MAHIYLGVADTEYFETQVTEFGLDFTDISDADWGWEYKVYGPREKIEKFLRESYCVGADEDGSFERDVIAEIED